MRKRDIPNRENHKTAQNVRKKMFTRTDAKNFERFKHLHQNSEKFEQEDALFHRNLRIIYDYIQGNPVKRLSESYELSDSTLYKIFKRYEIELRKNETTIDTKTVKAAVLKLVSANKSIEEISQKLGIPEAMISGFVTSEFAKMKKEMEVEREHGKKAEARSLDKESLEPAGRKRWNRFSPALSVTDAKSKGYFVNKNAKFKGEAEKPTEKEYTAVMGLLSGESVSLTRTERLIMDLLRASLEYSSRAYNMTDYSKDPYLVPDYLLPLDVMLQKDIVARYAAGSSVQAIASHHRIEPTIVKATVSGKLNREEFRETLFKSLSRFMTDDLNA